PSYATFGTRLGYTYKPWQLAAFFEGRNLTNKTYTSSVVVDAANRRFFEPADGRALYGGLEWRFRLDARSARWAARPSSRAGGHRERARPPHRRPADVPFVRGARGGARRHRSRRLDRDARW